MLGDYPLWTIIIALCLLSTCGTSDDNEDDIRALQEQVEDTQAEVDAIKKLYGITITRETSQ